MANFENMAKAFDRDEQRPGVEREREDVFTVLQSAAKPLRATRRFVEPGQPIPQEEPADV